MTTKPTRRRSKPAAAVAAEPEVQEVPAAIPSMKTYISYVYTMPDGTQDFGWNVLEGFVLRRSAQLAGLMQHFITEKGYASVVILSWHLLDD